jgi:hypothetical protein
MKKGILFVIATILIAGLIAQEKLNILKKDNSVLAVSTSLIDSVRVENNNSLLKIYKADNTAESVLVADVYNMFFTGTPDTVKINFSDNAVSVDNPLVDKGVDVVVSGADVVVNSSLTDNEVIYCLKGSSSSGSLKIYSTFRLELLLAGVNLTNNDGPAINIQSKKRIGVTIASGTNNTLGDGNTYATATEDQKAAFFSEGQLVFAGSGTLNVSSIAKHAICSDDYIEIESGLINITAAGKDAMHCNEKLLIQGGKTTVAATGDGFDCELGHITMTGGEVSCTLAASDTKGLKADSTVTIKGGKAVFTQSGTATKGIKAGKAVNIVDGVLVFNTTGGIVSTVLGSGFDIAYCSAIKSDADINISGGSITLTQTGAGSKGISADGNLNITGGVINSTNSGTGTTYKNSTGVTDSYNATTLTSDGNMGITGGTITTSNSGAAGKGISANGTLTIGSATVGQPVINVTTTGGSFVVSGKDSALPKAIKSDGALTIDNGLININSASDGLKSETSITVKGGTTIISKSYEGIESKYIYLQGGNTDVISSNDGLNATMGTTSGGTESNDGSLLSISGGTHYVNATGGDAVDSNGNITMTGGFCYANGPQSGMEEACDFNGNFNMNGGTFVGPGSSSNMTKAMSATSTQANMLLSSTSVVSNSTLMTVSIGGVAVASFKPRNGAYKILVSTPAMTKGASYVVYTGGTYAGGTTTYGYNSGGVFSATGATTRKSGTLSASSTVNSFSF